MGLRAGLAAHMATPRVHLRRKTRVHLRRKTREHLRRKTREHLTRHAPCQVTQQTSGALDNPNLLHPGASSSDASTCCSLGFSALALLYWNAARFMSLPKHASPEPNT